MQLEQIETILLVRSYCSSVSVGQQTEAALRKLNDEDDDDVAALQLDLSEP